MERKEVDINVKPIRKEILNPGNKYIHRVYHSHQGKLQTHTQARCNPKGNSCAAGVHAW